MAEPNWKPCVHSVQPRLVYLPPVVKTGAPWAGAQDCSRERILAAERAKRRRSLGARALMAGADCVSTIPRNFSLSAEGGPGRLREGEGVGFDAGCNATDGIRGGMGWETWERGAWVEM